MAKLYELTNELRQLADMLEEGEFDAKTIADTLEGSEQMTSLVAKADGISRMIKNWESDSEMYKNEVARLQAKRVALDNRIKSLKNYLKTCMEKAGIDSIKAGVFKPRIQPNSVYTVTVVDEELVPKEYFDKVPATKVINKDRLYDDIKELAKKKVEIPGVIYTKGNHIRIG